MSPAPLGTPFGQAVAQLGRLREHDRAAGDKQRKAANETARDEAGVPFDLAAHIFFMYHHTPAAMSPMTRTTTIQPLLAPAGMDSICPDRARTSSSLIEATRSMAVEGLMPTDCSWPATSARLMKFSTVLRSLCELCWTTCSVPIMPACANWYGVQIISPINIRHTAVAKDDFMVLLPSPLRLTLPSPPDDSYDDDQYQNARCIRARRHGVDPACEIASLRVRHRGNAIPGGSGVQAEGLQL